VSVSLSLQDDGRGNTFVAHAFREGSVVGTVVVHFVGVLGEGNAILALLIRLMLSLALLLYFS
jgi:hypothetical protein